MTNDDFADFGGDVAKLLESWCDRREYRALGVVLPAWLAANSLTDGSSGLRDALRTVCTLCGHLPDHERKMLKELCEKMSAHALIRG
ncbi:MAG TPA: hypothetical protein VGP76_00420 [Planctomycetaceae bacterium]|jgi:hypothetical protein|nr:hypothetical protein [Planctomycetaceae bacterium]